ncbi:hypothetical protein [Persicirhabdus sediminis]|uniref:Uncharacterized protein n=1 Tax=Persicirhabdus sediminis TaxID=454144 RepID=A0A8J7MAZ2_9BACT|nr:hypothetical protein [Persicirhabdus sediminis]MBK1790112.1 hypothetical protein [Persicirhabdus sediminis]
MVQTRLDRWLKEKFIYVTHVYVLRMPDFKLPRGSKVQELGAEKVGNYSLRIIVASNSAVEDLTNKLRDSRQMYAVKVVESNPWFGRFIAPKSQSFTYRIVFSIMTVGALYSSWVCFKWFMATPELSDIIKKTFYQFTSGDFN